MADEADQDDQWLYGDSNPEAIVSKLKDEEDETPNENVEDEPPENDDPSRMEEGSAVAENDEQQPENGVGDGGAKEEGEENDEDDDEDSDEDNVNVVIGDVSKAIPTYTSLNVHKRGGMVQGGKTASGKFAVEDFESVGVINGVSAVDYNIVVHDDKPWRKPGADITDYFNYGFNEDTWKAYCDRQQRMRLNESGVGLPNNNQQAPPQVQMSQPPPQMQRPVAAGGAGGGQIHVVSTRRVDDGNQMPPMGLPPPGYRPMPPGMPPGPRYGDAGYPPPYYGPDYANSSYDGQWRDGWTPNDLISPGHSKRLGDDNSQDSYEKDRRRSPTRERERDRDRDRDREHRDRDRERDDRERRERHRRSRSRSHGRERSRVRSRSRSPSHKKHKKKSRKSDKSEKKKKSDESE